MSVNLKRKPASELQVGDRVYGTKEPDKAEIECLMSALPFPLFDSILHVESIEGVTESGASMVRVKSRAKTPDEPDIYKVETFLIPSNLELWVDEVGEE